MSRAGSAWSTYLRVTAWCAVTAFALILRWVVPLNPISVGGAFDDELMVRGAHAILAGEWLGPWDTLTLAKPAGYPLFLAGAWLLQLPPTVAASLVLVLGACLVLTALRRLRVPFGLAIFVYAALVLNPALVSEQASRVYRDDFMAALVVVTIGAALWTGLALRQVGWEGFWWHTSVPAACLLGFSIGWLYITKSQATYVVAALAVALVLAMGVGVPRVRAGNLRLYGRVFLVIAAVGVSGVLPVLAVVAQNRANYGYAGTEDFYTGSYSAVWQAWAQVEAGERRAYVPITRAQREAVYAVSPTAASLAPMLELPVGAGWRSSSCQAMSICDESGAWFIWDLRDAFVHAGLAADESQFQAASQQVALDIRAACNDGRLRCSSIPAPVGMPPVDRVVPGEVLEGTRAALRATIGFADVQQRMATPQPLASASTEIWLETVTGVGDEPDSNAMQRRLAVSTPIVTALAWLYQAVAVLIGGPIVVFCFLHVIFGRSRRRLSLVALLMFVAVVVAAGASGIVAAAAGPFYASSSLYALPATSMLIFGVAVGIVSLVQFVRASVRGRLR